MTIFQIFVAAGIVQGFALALWLLLLARHQNHWALAWLAAFIAAFSGVIAGDLLNESALILQLPHWYQVFDPLVLCLGPTCYAYVRASVGLRAWSLWRALAHLSPALLLYAVLLPDFFDDRQTRLATIRNDLAITSAAGFDWVAVLLLGSVLLYLLMALWQVRVYRQSLEQHYSNTDKFKLRWLFVLLGFCTLTWTLWLLAVAGLMPDAESASRLCLVLGIYALGYGGLTQPLLWRQLHASAPSQTPDLKTLPTPTVAAQQITELAMPELATPNADVAEAGSLETSPLLLSLEPADTAAPSAAKPMMSAGPRYAKSGTNVDQLAEIGARLQTLMQTELSFLEAELSLPQLAARLQVNPHALSQTLNVHFGKNFFEYINDFRVKEVQRCFADPAFDGQSILDIALASGFASKATFNATFKRLAGLTPSASRRALRRA